MTGRTYRFQNHSPLDNYSNICIMATMQTPDRSNIAKPRRNAYASGHYYPAHAVLTLKSSSNAANTPCAVTNKTPGTEIASIHAGCAVVPGVPDFFSFPPDLPGSPG
jgi:hypothetical protein